MASVEQLWLPGTLLLLAWGAAQNWDVPSLNLALSHSDLESMEERNWEFFELLAVKPGGPRRSLCGASDSSGNLV